MSRVVLPHPNKVHVFLSKLLGGTMVFWMLWRAKHDWADIVVSNMLGPYGVEKCLEKAINAKVTSELSLKQLLVLTWLISLFFF